MDVLNLIPKLSLLESMLVPAASGLVRVYFTLSISVFCSHLTYLYQVVYLVYKRFEIHPSSPLTTMLLLLVVPSVSSAFLLRFYSVVLALVSGFSIFYATLLASIAVYRVSPWHPLAKYPGPLLAKVSQFWLTYEAAKGTWHLTLKDLHDQYGAYVRVGKSALWSTGIRVIQCH